MSNFTTNTAYDLLADKYKEIAVIAGKDRANLYLSAFKHLANDSKLKGVIPKSLAEVAMSVIRLGLEIDPAYKEVYIVPYKINKKDGSSFTIAQLIISPKGYRTLAAKDGILIKGFVVYKNDVFDYKFKGWEEEFIYQPNFEDRDNENGSWVWKNLKLAFAVAKLPNGEVIQSFLGKNQIVKRRNINNNSVWDTWAEEMIMKTIIKHCAKTLPRISEDSILKKAIEAEDVIYDEKRVKELSKPVAHNNLDESNKNNKEDAKKDADKDKKPAKIAPPKNNTESFDINSLFKNKVDKQAKLVQDEEYSIEIEMKKGA